MEMNPNRIRLINHSLYKKGDIVYWMNRDMRLNDNWALFEAKNWAEREKVGLHVLYSLDPHFLGGGRRQYEFKLNALREIEELCKRKGMGFQLLIGSDVSEKVIKWIKQNRIGGLVTDFSPLRIQIEWLTSISQSISIPVLQIDAHNIVPVWIASSKAEYGAYTFRPKIQHHLKEFLTTFPVLTSMRKVRKHRAIRWEILSKAFKGLEIPPISWVKAGELEAQKTLKVFLKNRLQGYADHRNDPNSGTQSDLSPYLHYGMLSPQRVALEVEKTKAPSRDKQAFLEELIVRRELAENFCFYNPRTYDSVESFPKWAKDDHRLHKKDKREYLYTLAQFEHAQTHDALWNAAQKEMIVRGKMHGYMRMYWAKKILEWSKSPSEAMRIAIILNDRYELDGRDPNGYAGIAWSVGGVHDRPWPRRTLFGRVRYMNRAGCERKFNTNAYIAKNS